MAHKWLQGLQGRVHGVKTISKGREKSIGLLHSHGSLVLSRKTINEHARRGECYGDIIVYDREG